MTRLIRTLIPALIVLALLAAGHAAADDGAGDDGAAEGGSDGLDALFDAPMVEEESGDADDAGGAEGSAAPSRSSVEWGGSFRYAPEGELRFPSWDALSSALRGEGGAERALRHDLGAVLYFDARPAGDFRVFGKARLDYALPPADSAAAGSATGASFDFSLFELFSDFQWDEQVFFRAGKQRADWGVGRFFSPADLISLAAIDPLDPDKEREGPVALKAHAPFDVHNGYLYLITGDFVTAGFRDPLDVAVGARGEFVIGGLELGLGGLLQADLVPKGIVTATQSLADFDLFGEAVIQRGTERNLLSVDDDGALTVTHHDERSTEWFAAATAGALYFVPDVDVVLAAQYYYNPLGYADSAALEPARRALLAPDGSGPPRTGPKPTPVDLLFFGRHYAGASAAWQGIADSDLSAAVYWIANLSDGSGVVRPSLTYRLLEHAELSLGARVWYGAADTEYAERVAVTLGASLGIGRF